MTGLFVPLLAGLLPTYVIRFSIFGVPTNLFEAGVWLAFLVTICVARTRKKFLGALYQLSVTYKVGILVFILSAIISTLYSPILYSSLGILKGWVITPLLFGLLGYASTKNDSSSYKRIIHFLIYSGLVVALLGISEIDGFMRIKSIYDVPNSLALFLVPIFILSLWIGIQTKNRWYQIVSVVLFIAIVATQSFGAMISIIGTVGMVFLLSYGSMKSKSWALSIAIIILCGAGMFFVFSGRIEYLVSPLTDPNTGNSATVRMQLWDVGLRLIQKHPITGVGLGQFEPEYQAELHRLFEEQENGGSPTSYQLQPEYVFRDPHNWILSFWLNMGLLGLISFCYLNGLSVIASIQKESIEKRAIASALISIFLFGLFDTIYWKNDLSAIWWLLILLV